MPRVLAAAQPSPAVPHGRRGTPAGALSFSNLNDTAAHLKFLCQSSPSAELDLCLLSPLASWRFFPGRCTGDESFLRLL